LLKKFVGGVRSQASAVRLRTFGETSDVRRAQSSRVSFCRTLSRADGEASTVRLRTFGELSRAAWAFVERSGFDGEISRTAEPPNRLSNRRVSFCRALRRTGSVVRSRSSGGEVRITEWPRALVSGKCKGFESLFRFLNVCFLHFLG